jgi:RNA polymerase sigma-70 factor (ECF subfamily)
MNTPAAGDLFERHHLIVFRFLRRMTGSAASAEDLAQEVFLRVVRGLEGYQDRFRERSWIFRIARNVLADRYRESQRSPPHLPLQDAFATTVPASQGLRVVLDQALAHLPDDDREAFLMREVGGLGYEEIADAMGSTRDAARMRIYRARIALREALGPSRAVRADVVTEVSK